MTSPLEELDRELKPTEKTRVARLMLKIYCDDSGTWPRFVDRQIDRLDRRIAAAEQAKRT